MKNNDLRLSDKYKLVIAENNKLNEENKKLKTDNEILTYKNMELKTDIKYIMDELDEIRNKIIKLKIKYNF